MTMDEEAKFNLIEKYLQGEFSQEERKAIEQKIAEDPDLWQEANLHRNLHQFLQNQEEIKLRDQLSALEKARFKKNKPLLTYGIAAAISLLVVAGIFFLYDQQQISPAEIVAEQFEPYPMVLNERNVGLEDQAIQLAINAYLDQDYPQAITYFNELVNRDTLVTLARFYQGVSLLALNRSAESVEILAELKDTEQSLIKQQTLWYLGLSYLLQEEQEKALSTFSELAGYENYKQEEAQRIIEQLE